MEIQVNSHIDISIVVPIYNNEESISILISQIQEEMLHNYPNFSYEVILVDDGSEDASWQEMIKFRENMNVVAIRFTRNFGQLGAMKAGYDNAKGRCIISISGDLQDPTSLITEMIRSWQRGFELVLCERVSREDNIAAKLTSRLAYFFLTLDIKEMPKGGFDVFLFSSNLRNNIMNLVGRFNFIQGDLLYFGHKFEVIPYHRVRRVFGKSGYTFKKRLQNFLDAIIDSNYTVINFFMFAGIVISTLSFLLGSTVLLGNVLERTPFKGFILLACSTLFIGGIQLILTSLVGQYVWRIYDAIRRKPPYHIEEIIKSI
jgi:dolichol-phosphate mannosyltransferase